MRPHICLYHARLFCPLLYCLKTTSCVTILLGNKFLLNIKISILSTIVKLFQPSQKIKKGTKQPCMIQEYVRSQKKSIELLSCICSKDFHRSSTFKNTSSNIYLNVTINYSTTWPMLDAPLPHTKWFPTRDIGFFMEMP